MGFQKSQPAGAATLVPPSASTGPLKILMRHPPQTMNCFHLGGRAFHSRSLPPTQYGCAALHKSPAGERHTKKANLLQRSRHPIRVPSTPALAHAPPACKAHRAHTPTPQLSSSFDSRAAHARTHMPAALASVPFGFVLVRVRVRKAHAHEIHEKAGSISSTCELPWPARGDMKKRLPTKPVWGRTNPVCSVELSGCASS
jgi:hypothetical protein